MAFIFLLLATYLVDIHLSTNDFVLVVRTSVWYFFKLLLPLMGTSPSPPAVMFLLFFPFVVIVFSFFLFLLGLYSALAFLAFDTTACSKTFC